LPLLGLSACAGLASAPSIRVITGQLTYWQRIALPRQAIAIVEARASGSTPKPLLAEVRMPLEGRGPPLPFRLDIRHDAATLPIELTGAIEIAGQIRWLSETRSLVLQEASLDVGEIELRPHTPLAFEMRWQCGDDLIRFGMDGDAPLLVTPKQRIRMQAAVAASGSRFVAVGDEQTSFWTKGQVASFVLNGRPMPECRLLG
jgi:Predicted periplasmic protein (DUF2091).